MTRALSLLVVLAFGAIFAGVFFGYSERAGLSALAQQYLALVPRELGAANVVTGILITYRGFDTLGEVAVLFMVAAGVGMLLADERDTAMPQTTARRPSELVGNGAEVILPLVFVFGAYVIKNGHLSAGGGFQGGAVVASGTMLLLLALPGTRLNHAFLGVTESVAGVVYVGIGILGLVFAAGFLDSHVLPPGEFGTFISAGTIPVISALLGIKVGAELSVIIDRFRN